MSKGRLVSVRECVEPPRCTQSSEKAARDRELDTASRRRPLREEEPAGNSKTQTGSLSLAHVS